MSEDGEGGHQDDGHEAAHHPGGGPGHGGGAGHGAQGREAPGSPRLTPALE